MLIFATLFRRCPTLWKSTLRMTTLFRRCLTLFSSTLKNTMLSQRYSTLQISTLTYTTMFQRWLDGVWRRDVIPTQKQRWTDVEMSAGYWSKMNFLLTTSSTAKREAFTKHADIWYLSTFPLTFLFKIESTLSSKI